MIGYDTWTYERAAGEFGLDALPPASAEVRVVSEFIQHAGDLRLDEGEGGSIFDGVWVFAAGLQVLGSLENGDVDSGPSVFVRGDLRARQVWLSGASLHVSGELVVDRLVLATYNHGRLRVEGQTRCPLVLSLDHDTQLVGGLLGELFESEAEAVGRVASSISADGRVELERLWDMALTTTDLLRPEDSTNAAPANSAHEGYVLAERLLARWEQSGLVILRPSYPRNDFLDQLVGALDDAGHSRSPAGALSDWLIDHPDVEDVIGSDEELVRL